MILRECFDVPFINNGPEQKKCVRTAEREVYRVERTNWRQMVRHKLLEAWRSAKNIWKLLEILKEEIIYFSSMNPGAVFSNKTQHCSVNMNVVTTYGRPQTLYWPTCSCSQQETCEKFSSNCYSQLHPTVTAEHWWSAVTFQGSVLRRISWWHRHVRASRRSDFAFLWVCFSQCGREGWEPCVVFQGDVYWARGWGRAAGESTDRAGAVQRGKDQWDTNNLLRRHAGSFSSPLWGRLVPKGIPSKG